MNKNITTSNLIETIDNLAIEFSDKHGHHIKKESFSNDNGTLKNSGTKQTQLVPIENDFIQISKSVFVNRSVNELKVLARIINELCFNNPLWYCNDRESTQVKSALADIVKLQFISYIAGSKGFFIINPLFIRKGNTFQIYPSLAAHFHEQKSKSKNWKLSIRDIKKLKFKDFDTRFPHL